MKKHLTIVVILLFTINSSAQIPFAFNADGTFEKIEYKKDRTAQELYEITLDWINKYYSHPDLVLKKNIANKNLKIEGTIYKAFDKEIKDYYADLTNYEAKYNLKIEFHDGKYIVTYEHVGFILYNNTNPLNPTDISLQDMIDNPSKYKRGWKKNYEYRIEKLLNSLNHYIETNELIYK